MASNDSLRAFVGSSVRRYFEDMGNTEPENLYDQVLAQVEPPLIEETLAFTGGNQSRAARILGMTRNTLRSKINRYGIEPGQS